MKKTILLIEDDPSTTEGIKIVLEDDYTVTAAKNVAEARALIEGGKEFDLLLCDRTLPDGTGIGIFDLYRAGGGKGAFILFSASVREHFTKEIGDRDFGYLGKPFSSDALLAAVEAELAKTSGGPAPSGGGAGPGGGDGPARPGGSAGGALHAPCR